MYFVFLIIILEFVDILGFHFPDVFDLVAVISLISFPLLIGTFRAWRMHSSSKNNLA